MSLRVPLYPVESVETIKPRGIRRRHPRPVDTFGGVETLVDLSAVEALMFSSCLPLLFTAVSISLFLVIVSSFELSAH